MIPAIARPVLTYGFGPDADFRAMDLHQEGLRVEFRVARPDAADWLHVTLNMPGRHNVLNALAAIAIAHEVGVSDEAIRRGLDRFEGIGRRFQVHGDVKTAAGTVTLVDDYGHHPREVQATIAAARAAWPERRLVIAFQPHRYSRTRDLFEDFTEVLSAADAVLVLEVYAAGEKPIAGADSRTLCRAIRARGQVDPVFVSSAADLAETLKGVLRDGDVVVTLGAGDIGAAAAHLPADIEAAR
jgi:UDP-N-acetylmuramate--alanine ligase